MAEPTQAEVDAVSATGASAKAIIAAIDQSHGKCVPVDALKAKMRELWNQSDSTPAWARRVLAWLDCRGWLDGETAKRRGT